MEFYDHDRKQNSTLFDVTEYDEQIKNRRVKYSILLVDIRRRYEYTTGKHCGSI